ncbi:MAG: hypothetical protein ABI333_24770 [bacterium]
MKPGKHVLQISLLIAVAVALLTAGCAGDSGPENRDPYVADGCNPLAPNWDCMLPYPTDYYLVADDTLPSGYRVVIPDSAVPLNHNDDPVNVPAGTPMDGFSLQPQILAVFPFDVDDSNLVFHTDDVFESTGPDSPTVLMEADTGLRILHFAELDPRANSDERRGLLIRPLVRLEERTRYIVAIRRLQLEDGAGPVPAGEGFVRLRDGTADSHELLSQLVDHYEANIFTPLAEAQIDRAELQLAWDFTTASEEHLTRDLLRARELAMAALEATPPVVTITDEYFDPYADGEIFSRVQGTIEVPLFVEHDHAGAMLFRDANGDVAQNGTAEVDFTILIPSSVAEATPVDPARLVQFGHGFFGKQNEVEGGFVRSFSQRLGVVVIGIDWWGMSTRDIPDVIGDIMDDTSHAVDFTDRVHQGLINQIAVTYAARATLQDVDELHVDGTLVYDPDEIYYYGISQGAILGATYASLSPHIEKYALSVGGCSLPFMMFRSSNFVQFLVVIEVAVEDYLDQQKLVGMLQNVFERQDPITYAPHVLNDLFPGSPAARQVLLQIGIADAQVPNMASHLCARSMGLSQLTPAYRTIPLVPDEAGPLSSALVEFDFHIPEPWPGLYAEPPADGNEAHEGVRRTAAGQDQIDAFFRPGGMIENFCDGNCDPE